MELSKERVITAFVDGDRGGELILRELFQVAEVDFVARAPRAHEVEELTQKQIMKCLRNKIPGEQFMEMFGLEADGTEKKNGRSEKAEKLERFTREDKAERASDEKPEAEEKTFEKPAMAEVPVPRQEREERPRQERREERPRQERTEQRREAPAPRQEREERREERPRQEQRGRGGDRYERREERAPTTPVETPSEMPVEASDKAKKLSAAQEKYRGMINEMSSTSKAKIMDMQGAVRKEVPVKELVNTLKGETEPISTIVFDGIITQRILDIAAEQKIGTLVGTKMGNITKQPSSVDIWTKEDLN
jgi:DNA primase